MKDLRNGIDKVFLDDNLYKIRTYTERIKEYKKVFLGFRDGTYTFYYYGYAVLYFKISKGKVVITTRDKFNNKKLDDKYRDFMSKIPLKKDKEKTIEYFKAEERKKNFVIYEKDYIQPGYPNKTYSVKAMMEYLLKNIMNLLEERFDNKETSERAIQNRYATDYSLKDEIYIVDMELTLPEKIKSKLKEKNIEGRYDMVALHKVENKYKLVFIELKSKKDACVGDAGINKHIKDMRNFLGEYNTSGELKETISEFVKNIINSKKILKLITIDEIEIDMDNPEFWLLFDMQDGTDCSSIENIEKIIDDKLEDKNEKYLKIYIGNINKKELKCIK